jgi:molybdate transport system permease protein
LVLRAPWSRIGDILGDEATREALTLSLLISTTASILSLAFGLPLAWVLVRCRVPGRTFIRALVVLPLVLPPVVGGIALLSAFGRRGLLGGPLENLLGISLPFTTGAAILAATFVSLPLLILVMEAGIRGLDPRLEAAAAVSGASRRYTGMRITLPLLAPSIAAGMILAWARALGEFGATLMFAGNLQGRTQTLPLAVFERSQSDPRGATVLALLLVVICLLVLVFLRKRLLPR